LIQIALIPRVSSKYSTLLSIPVKTNSYNVYFDLLTFISKKGLENDCEVHTIQIHVNIIIVIIRLIISDKVVTLIDKTFN